MKTRLVIFLTILVMFSGLFYGHKHRAPKRNYSDFHCFYTAGKRMLNSQNIYVLRDEETSEFRYAPVFALVMSAFALMNEDNADTLWFIINFCLLVISFVLLKRLAIPQKLDFKTGLLLYLLTILGVARFILHNFDSGQSNILMLSAILAGLYFISQKGDFLGAAMLAFSMMIKYTPLIFIPYFILRKRIKLSFLIVISLAIYLLLPTLFIGLKTNLSYLKNLITFLTNSTIFDQMTILDPKNQSLFSLFHRIFTNCVLYFYAPPMPFNTWNLTSANINLIFLVSALALYLIILCPHPKMHPEHTPSFYANIDCALLIICAAMFNLNSWMSNYILLLMPYFLITHYLIKQGFKDKIILILWLVSYALNFITLKSILGKTLAYKIHFYSPFTISALITFAALLKIKFTRKSIPKIWQEAGTP